jgi:hypothetical protein
MEISFVIEIQYTIYAPIVARLLIVHCLLRSLCSTYGAIIAGNMHRY